MKILYIIGVFPAISSGACVLNEMVELKKRGHEIKILAGGKEHGEVHEDWKKYFSRRDIIYPNDYKKYSRGLQKIRDFAIVFCVDFATYPSQTATKIWNILKFNREAWQVIDAYLRLRTIMSNRENFDMIHIPFISENNLYNGYRLSKYFQIPITVTLRAKDIYGKKDKEKILKNNLLKNASKIFAISKYNRDYAKKSFNLKDVKIIHSAINLERFFPKKKEMGNHIITVCRFVEKKRN